MKYIRIAAALLAALLCLAACGDYNPAVNRPGHNLGDTDTETDPIVTDVNGNIDEDPFTVTLIYDGKPYVPAETSPMSVRWNDGFSLYSAPVGSDGTARIGGLDGDYRVTVEGIPAGYGYNPNIHTATNENRNLEVELYRLIETGGPGDQLYNSIRIKETGVYCVELQGPDHEVFYEFSPSESGTYAVESWMDTTANLINPYANYYGANVAFKSFLYSQDDGGVSNTYTKNFKLIVEIADENIGAHGATGFTFGMKSTSIKGEYPVRMYFAITLDGDFQLEHIVSELMLPEETLRAQENYDPALYTFVGAEEKRTVGDHTASVFDGDNYKLWPASEGGDDYYHLYDETAYPETGGYGPILYAKISEPTRFMENPFTTLEYAGNKALTVSNGTENYKLFIEGYDALNSYTLSAANPNGIPPYFCTLECPCRLEGTNDSIAITGQVGACITGCEKCHADCRNIEAEAIGQKGYGDYTNDDGCYAVTAELKDFLQKYSISQLLFFDGNGFVETNDTISVYAAEDDQWLFACGYYVPN